MSVFTHTVRQVVCVANRELTAADELQKLEYICSQRVELLSRKGDLFIVNTLWKKPKGKAILQKVWALAVLHLRQI